MADPTLHQEAEQEQMESLASGGALSSALLFGILALTAALVLAPALDNGTQHVANLPSQGGSTGIDATITGSISAQSERPSQTGTVRYTIRRSVTQKNPSEPCFIYADGSQRGDC